MQNYCPEEALQFAVRTTAAPAAPRCVQSNGSCMFSSTTSSNRKTVHARSPSRNLTPQVAKLQQKLKLALNNPSPTDESLCIRLPLLLNRPVSVRSTGNHRLPPPPPPPRSATTSLTPLPDSGLSPVPYRYFNHREASTEGRPSSELQIRLEQLHKPYWAQASHDLFFLFFFFLFMLLYACLAAAPLSIFLLNCASD